MSNQYETDDTASWVCSDCGEFYDSCCCNLSELEKLLADYKSEPKVGQWQDYEDDEYADKGMSRSDFINKEYT